MPSLQLIVLRTSNIARLSMFYRALGLELVPEKHGNGPAHYSVTIGPLVIELYPKPHKREYEHTNSADIMLGFDVGSIEETVFTLWKEGFTVRPDLKVSQGRRVGTFYDPDGRQVRLTETVNVSQSAPP